MSNRVWYTLNYPSFNNNEYLYHYTSVSTAFKILYTNQLRFSKLSKTNDTTESKPKISIANDEDAEKMKDIIEFFLKMNQEKMELMCFSRDSTKSKSKNGIPENIMYDDYFGRGFALPRMWAQYAQNNKGVCFVFNKQRLIDSLKKIRYLSFAFAARTTTSTIDFDKYISIWNEFIKEYYPKNEHKEMSVTKQLRHHVDSGSINISQYAGKFRSKNNGAYILLRTNKTNRAKPIQTEIMNFFNISSYHGGALKIVTLDEFNSEPQAKTFVKNLEVSAFKVVVNH